MQKVVNSNYKKILSVDINYRNYKYFYIYGKNYLGDHVCFLDFAQKAYITYGIKSYIFVRGFNQTLIDLSAYYKYVKLIDLATFSGQLHRLQLIVQSLFVRTLYYLDYDLSWKRYSIKVCFIKFLSFFCCNFILRHNYINNYQDKLFVNFKGVITVFDMYKNFIEFNNFVIDNNLEHKLLFAENINKLSEFGLEKDKYITFTIGASALRRSLSLDNWKIIVDVLAHKYKYPFVLLGAGSLYEKQIATFLEFYIKSKNLRVYNLIGIIDFDTVLNILNNCTLNIGANTGLTLLSFYLNKRTITFSEYSVSKYYSFTNNISVDFMNTKLCKCQAKINNDVNNYDHNSIVGCCLDLIDVKLFLSDII